MTVPIPQSEYAEIFSCLRNVRHAGLAVSGGADSTALMHLAHRWRAAAGGSAPRLTVLSVDHSLRDGSADEAQWVADQAAILGLDAAILRWDAGTIDRRIQERARFARYSLMANYAHANGLDALVTAHHLDDQAETVLMRLGRGSGIDGLAGIPRSGQWAGLAVLRPLLDVSRARLVATLEDLGVGWLEDPSNEDSRFERVRIRQAIGKFGAIGIDPAALARSAVRLRRAREALDMAASAFLGNEASVNDVGYGQIRTGAFRHAPREIALRALAKMIQTVGGRINPPPLARVESLAEGICSGDETSRTLGGCRVVPDRQDILVLRETGRTALETMVLRPGESGLWDNRFHVSLDAVCRSGVEVRALGERAYGHVRARLGAPINLPAHAAEGLVSFWRNEDVLCVPTIGYFAESGEGRGCAARFVNRLAP
ncbi:MAG: tRNA lysidine(34) synthetase TilS [Hyphomicrobiaceae bacterium]|nr:tRNA lysidine(34) synthetase TilS [Hyphomicrobiaceae bacterium]